MSSRFLILCPFQDPWSKNFTLENVCEAVCELGLTCELIAKQEGIWVRMIWENGQAKRVPGFGLTLDDIKKLYQAVLACFSLDDLPSEPVALGRISAIQQCFGERMIVAHPADLQKITNIKEIIMQLAKEG